MPKLPKPKTEAKNTAFQLLSKRFIQDATHLTPEILRKNIIDLWELDSEAIVSSELALTRELVLETAWRDFMAVIGFIITEIAYAAAASIAYKNNSLNPMGSELLFSFNSHMIKFIPNEDAKLQTTLDLSIIFYRTDPRHVHPPTITLYESILLEAIANTHATTALELIEDGVDINKYSYSYGSNPILLALSKGYHHHQNELEDDQTHTTENQTQIIDTLLLLDDCDINAVHLINGMTPMHIVCMRGDDPTLIELLIQKGAKLEMKDCKDKTPADYLNTPYHEMKEIMKNLTGNQPYGLSGNPPHISMTTTLPTEVERARNIVLIKKIFARVEEENTAPAANPNKRPRM